MIKINKKYQGDLANRKDLYRVEVPDMLPKWKDGVPDNAFWKPIQHGELADGVMEALKGIGAEVKSEEWLLTMGGAGLVGILKMDMSWSSLLLELDEVKKRAVDEEIQPTLLVRHSNNAKYSLSITMGAEVKVCKNGMMAGVGIFQTKRRHSHRLDLQEYIKSSIEGAFEQSIFLVRGSEIMKGVELTDQEGDSLIIQMAEGRIYPWTMVKDVVAQWREPDHEDFEPRTAWSLYNAVTEAAKKRSPEGQIESLAGAFQHLVPKSELFG